MRCTGCRAGQSVSDTGEEGLVTLGADTGNAGESLCKAWVDYTLLQVPAKFTHIQPAACFHTSALGR